VIAFVSIRRSRSTIRSSSLGYQYYLNVIMELEEYMLQSHVCTTALDPLRSLLNSSSSDDSGAATLPEPPSTRNTHVCAVLMLLEECDDPDASSYTQSRFLSFAPSSSWRSLPPLSRLASSTYSATSPPPVEDVRHASISCIHLSANRNGVL
jgi:hypothetical protein